MNNINPNAPEEMKFTPRHTPGPQWEGLNKRQRGRLWARGFGFLLSIRREEDTKLTNIYRTGFGEAPMR